MLDTSKEAVIAEMQGTLAKLQASDPATCQALNSDCDSTLAQMDPETRRKTAILSLTDSIACAVTDNPISDVYHPHDALTGLIQTCVAQDKAPVVLQGGGEGNPVVWIPAGIKGILEHFKPKHPFVPATAASRIQIPDQCRIALLADWGFPNDHAARLGNLAIGKGADYVIHLGDIYYSGAASECQTFLDRWPLRDSSDEVKKGYSYTLNGNHEMYSLGYPYFDMVLPAFGQEASYFTLFNTHWQFQGLDSAYVPFSIGQGSADNNLRVQYQWLVDSIQSNPDKRNIFLTHQQPVSAYLDSFQAAQPLMNEARQLMQQVGGTAIYAWIFGHEHRCIIYDDRAPASFRARLIGNGSIGHCPQKETQAARDETGTSTNTIFKANLRSLSDNDQVAVSSFAFLTLNGPNINVQYFDEDDYLFYEENWDAAESLWEKQRT